MQYIYDIYIFAGPCNEIALAKQLEVERNIVNVNEWMYFWVAYFIQQKEFQKYCSHHFWGGQIKLIRKRFYHLRSILRFINFSYSKEISLRNNRFTSINSIFLWTFVVTVQYLLWVWPIVWNMKKDEFMLREECISVLFSFFN